MRKIKIIILAIYSTFLFNYNFFAQSIEMPSMLNPYFLINGGNLSGDYCSNIVSSGIAINESLLENWKILHGTPNFSFGTTYPNSIDIFGSRLVGEGIVGNYHFQSGRTYSITIGELGYFSNGLVIAIGQGPLPKSTICSPITCGSGIGSRHGQIPSFPSNTIFISPTMAFGTNFIPVAIPTTYGNYDWIALAAFDPNACDFGHILEFVDVRPFCEQSISIFSQVIPKNLYTGYMNIFVGSIYGSTSTSMSAVGSSAVFEALQSITISPGFIANPNSSNFAEFKIGGDCRYSNQQTRESIVQFDSLAEIFNTSSQNFEILSNLSLDSPSVTKLDTDIVVFPSPTSSMVEFLYESDLIVEKIRIIDKFGNSLKEVLGTSIINNSINVSDLKSDVYIIEFIFKDNILRKRFTKI